MMEDRSVPLVLYVVQWATVVFVVRLVCLFKAHLGPYAKPLTVWTAVACTCSIFTMYQFFEMLTDRSTLTCHAYNGSLFQLNLYTF